MKVLVALFTIGLSLLVSLTVGVAGATSEDIASASNSTMTWQEYTTIDGLASDFAWSIASTQAETFAVGSPISGITLVNGEDVSVVTMDNGLADNTVQTISHHDEHVWVGHYASGISHFDGNAWQQISPREGLQSGSVGKIAFLDDGDIWVGHQPKGTLMLEGGLSRWNGAEWDAVPYLDGLLSTNIRDIVEDDAGRVWVAVGDYATRYGLLTGGIVLFDGDTQTVFGYESTLPSSDVMALTIDEDGAVWAATGSGVARFEDGEWVQISAETEYTFDIIQDKYGDMWVATKAGVNRLHDGVWSTISEADGLISNNVNELAVDDMGHLLVATDAGVSRLTLTEQPITHTIFIPTVVSN